MYVTLMLTPVISSLSTQRNSSGEYVQNWGSWTSSEMTNANAAENDVVVRLIRYLACSG
jgi:ABC-type enterochelin transport system permease subunit